MKFILLMLIVIFELIFEVNCSSNSTSGRKIWALLAAGSSGYDNYRHQADISHAYQILRRHGVPEERIIVMMYDDIAYSSENPTPGVLINRPNGTNVYAGVKVDYSGANVTPRNFINVLMGYKKAMKKIGTGRVIKSGPQDDIFVNFVDHGAPGLLGFPKEGVLHARKLNKAIKKMYKKNKYANMVFYVEACNAGSMFASILRDNLNVYATTAANPYQHSYACYYDTYRQTYIGDLYSVNWMEDSDQEDISKESLIRQYDIVKIKTNRSNVMEYGDLKLSTLSVSNFQGPIPKMNSFVNLPMDGDIVDARDVPIAILNRKIATAKVKSERVHARRKLRTIIKRRKYLDTKVLEIVQRVVKRVEEVDMLWTKTKKLRNFSCYETAVNHFHKNCFSLNDNEYALEYLQKFVNVCEYGISVTNLTASMDEMCKDIKYGSIK